MVVAGTRDVRVLNATHPNASASARLIAVEPAWTSMRLAREAIALEPRTILHCSPPAAACDALDARP